MALKIAIIGTGPSGIYAGEKIKKKILDSEIDFFEKLPTPYGLVRYGVAPDHQGTKNVTHLFDKFFQQDGVRLIGNIEIGKEIKVSELQENYDAVILATGARKDKKLNIPGEELPGVIGSATFVGWYNSHPDFHDLAPIPQHAKSAIVIGNGNVAIDIARILTKSTAEMQNSDLNRATRHALDQAQIDNVTIAGRRSPVDASFTPPELRELGKLTHTTPQIIGAELPETPPAYLDISKPEGRIKAKILEIMKSFKNLDEKESPKNTIKLQFLARPTAILGTEKVESVQFERMEPDGQGGVTPTQELFELPADLVVTAVGYQSEKMSEIDFDAKTGRFPNEEGHIQDNLYVVGWAKRGPSGTIPTNRPCSNKTAELILKNVRANSDKTGPKWLDQAITDRNLKITTFEDWQKIDQFEINNVTNQKGSDIDSSTPRQKVTTLSEMLNIL